MVVSAAKIVRMIANGIFVLLSSAGAAHVIVMFYICCVLDETLIEPSHQLRTSFHLCARKISYWLVMLFGR
ncbi:unnamed protein product [Toxocara canis]|uniref:Secreted protein n=1 Tax=Toxocara canis TaxID=6265 RepID=A0A183V9K9_TOXCA|nr:unnamed protein product [Toxocara canis]